MDIHLVSQNLGDEIYSTFWLIRMISISSLLTNRLKHSSISLTLVSGNKHTSTRLLKKINKDIMATEHYPVN